MTSVDLTDRLDRLHVEPGLFGRWTRYATAIGALNATGWALDAVATHLEPEAVAAQVAEGMRRLLDALPASCRGHERETLLRELDGCAHRLRVLLGDGE